MSNIIALLAVTGMRIGEALRLNVGDIDRGGGTMLIRANKHGPDRLIPLHASTIAALAQYETSPARGATCPRPDGPLFVTVRGTGYQRDTIEGYFHRLRDTADFTWEGPAPTLHDLRHTFATRQMIRSYTQVGVFPLLRTADQAANS